MVVLQNVSHFSLSRAHTHTHTQLRVHALSWSHSQGTADPRSNSLKDRTATETILVLADPNLELQIIHNSCSNCLDFDTKPQQFLKDAGIKIMYPLPKYENSVIIYACVIPNIFASYYMETKMKYFYFCVPMKKVNRYPGCQALKFSSVLYTKLSDRV